MTAVDVAHVAPPTYVSPPTPNGLRFGLFSVAQMVDTPELWEFGVEWESLAGVPAGIVSTICPPDDGSDPAGIPLALRDGGGTVTALPFSVFGSYNCSTFSRSAEEAENRARQHLVLGEERAVEQAIAAGGFDNQQTFQGATDLTPGTAVSVNAGVGLLESHLAKNYGGIGTIHAPRVASPWFPAEKEGQRLETKIGTLVAFGGGYDVANVGPDGTEPAASEVWLYATARPQIRRSDVFVTPDENQRPSRDQNDYMVAVQRVYVVGWDPPTAAVRVEPGVAEGSIAPSS